MRACTIPGCPKRYRAKGYCSKHYHRWRVYGDPLCIDRRRLRRSPHWETVRAMNREGKRDPAIAKAIGHTRALVEAMRRKMGLPPVPGREMKQCPTCHGTGQIRRTRQIAQEGA